MTNPTFHVLPNGHVLSATFGSRGVTFEVADDTGMLLHFTVDKLVQADQLVGFFTKQRDELASRLAGDRSTQVADPSQEE